MKAPNTMTARPRRPVLDALLHELVKRQAFACYADLTEALKREAARLKIPYDSASVSAAIVNIEHVRGGRLVPPMVQSHRHRVDDDRQTASIGRDEAAQLYRELLARYAERAR